MTTELDTAGPLTLTQYQQAAKATDIYPRVFTEGQVKEIVLRVLQDRVANTDAQRMDDYLNSVLDDHTTTWNEMVLHVLGLASEAGELAGKVKKIGRDSNGQFESADQFYDLEKETGDVLWYTAIIADDMSLPLGFVGKSNIDKLKSRQERGVLGGSGDNR